MNSQAERSKRAVCFALSLDTGFNSFLNSIKKEAVMIGQVHSVFKRVVNFQDHNQQIYSILHRDIDNRPYSIRVDQSGFDNFLELPISVGQAVILKNGSLEIKGTFIIKFEQRELWEPEKLKIYPDQTTVSLFKKNIKIYNKCLLNSGVNGGGRYYYLRNHVHLKRLSTPSLLEKELDRRIGSFLFKLNNQVKGLKDSILSIIGLGNGLTPAGDDFISGFISVLNLIQESKVSLTLQQIKEILKNNELSTTELSLTMIRASLEGRISENLKDLIGGLVDSEDLHLVHKIEQVFSIGSSSGTDLSIGVVIGLKYGLDILGKWRQIDVIKNYYQKK